MKAGLKNLCGLLTSVLCLMSAMSSIAAVHGGICELYIQAIIYGLSGAGVAFAALLRM